MMSANKIKSSTDCDYDNERDWVNCSSEDFVFQLAQSCAKKPRLDNKKIVVKVLQGGYNSHQQKYLLMAKNHMIIHHRDVYDLLLFEELNNDQIKQRKWDPETTVDWLLDSDIHFVLTHVHQGLLGLPGQDAWNVQSIGNHFWRLKCHRGFPNGIHLKCNIFLQDKWSYLVAVKDRVLPTLKVPLTVDLYDNSAVEAITK